MKTNKIIKIMSLVLIGSFLALLGNDALAQSNCSATTVGQVADCFYKQIKIMPKLISAIVYIGGILLGIQGILKLKEVNEKKGQVSIVVPIVFLLGSALLLALPTAINFGVNTLGLANVTVGAGSGHGASGAGHTATLKY